MRSHTVSKRSRGAKLLLSFALACAAALACVVCVASGFSRQARGAVATPQASPTPVKPAERRSTVRGRVLYNDTLRPLRRAIVRLMRVAEQREPEREGKEGEQEAEEGVTGMLKTTVTNRRGEFLFGDVRAGKYFISVDAPGIVASGRGFVIGRFGVTSQSGAGSYTIVDTDGLNDVTTEVRVQPGASISGRVTYADGEPATNVTVILFARKGDTASRIVRETVAVDDRGRYRIEGLPAGEYLLAASEMNTAVGDTGRAMMSTTAATTIGAYYPSASSMTSAAPVRLSAGGEVSDIDIMFPDGELRQVSGIVKWGRSATPVSQALVKLQHAEEPNTEMEFSEHMRGGSNVGFSPRIQMMFYGLFSRNVQLREADEQGQWSFSDVAEGNYILTVVAPLPERKRTHTFMSSEGRDSSIVLPDVVQKRVPVVVRGGDVSGFNVTLGEGGRISGTVAVEGDARPLWQGVHVGALTTGDEPLFKLPQPVASDATFEIEGLTPGEVFLDVVVPSDRKLYVKSITAPDGADLMRSPLVVRDETSTTGIRVLLASDGATLTGRAISSADAAPVPGALLMLLPADPALRYSRASRAAARAGLDGSFTLNCAPGSYYLLTWPPGDEPEHPAQLLQAGPGQPLALRPNERKTLDVRVAAPSPNGP